MKCRKYNNQLDELKKWFLEDMAEQGYDEVTIKNFENFMHRVRRYEIQYTLPKVIHEYNYHEILLFLKTLGSRSQESLVSYLNMIRRYFDFCRREFKMDDNIDFLKPITCKALEKCVNKGKSGNRYLTRRKLDKIIDGFVNDNDKAFLLLMFEGISGKENSEILNLKKEDVDLDNNLIKVMRNNKETIIKISEELSDILDRVIETDIVYYENDYNSRVDTLITSEYVFRPTMRFLDLNATKQKIEDGEYNGKHIESKTLSSRVFKLIKLYSNMPYITPISIVKSGIATRAINELGLEAEKQEFAEWVCEKEGYSVTVSYKMYSVYLDIVEQIKEEMAEDILKEINNDIIDRDEFDIYIKDKKEYSKLSITFLDSLYEKYLKLSKEQREITDEGTYSN